MKKLSEQNYYQILEVDTRATKVEIIKAFQLAEETYGTDSLATYSLLTSEEKRKILSKIREAYQILVDDESRKLYDQYLIKTSQVPPEKVRAPQMPLPAAPVHPPAPPRELPPPSGDGGGAPGLREDYSGRGLRKMREQKGVDLKQIAQVTKINITYLRLLEEDNYALLPAPVYIKGFLAEYARYLGLPADKVKEGYMQLYSQVRSL